MDMREGQVYDDEVYDNVLVIKSPFMRNVMDGGYTHDVLACSLNDKPEKTIYQPRLMFP
jgi:hypothetical protein